MSLVKQSQVKYVGTLCLRHLGYNLTLAVRLQATLSFVVYAPCVSENNSFGPKLLFLFHCLECNARAPFVFANSRRNNRKK